MNIASAPTYVDIDVHLAAIRELIKSLTEARADVTSYKLLLGQNIKALKDARPHTWIEIVKAECGLRRRSAYYYLTIAEGKPAAQHRAENRKRVAKHRALHAQNEDRQAQIGKLNTQVDRLKTEMVGLQDGKVLKTENVSLHAILKRISETLGAAIGLTGHFEQNRDAIVHKMNVAKNMADAANVANPVPTSSSRTTTLDNSLFAKAMSAPPSSQVH